MRNRVAAFILGGTSISKHIHCTHFVRKLRPARQYHTDRQGHIDFALPWDRANKREKQTDITERI